MTGAKIDPARYTNIERDAERVTEEEEERLRSIVIEKQTQLRYEKQS